jgi:hypothetical protein
MHSTALDRTLIPAGTDMHGVMAAAIRARLAGGEPTLK